MTRRHPGNVASNTRVTADTVEDSSTPYGDLTVVDRDNRIDISSEYPISEQKDIVTSGVTRLSDDSVVRIRANNSTESAETTDVLRYSPGYIAELGVAIRIPEAPTGSQEVRWGYWDGTDGAYFGWDSDGVFVEAQRNGTRQGKIYRDSWSEGDNIDAPSLLQSGAITRIFLALYNFGSIGFEIFQRGQTGRLEKERLHNLTVEDNTTLSKQNLPIRVEVDNPDASDFDVFLADRQATIRGQNTSQNRIKGERATDVSLSGETWVPVLTIRRKEGYEGINIGVFSLKSISSDPVYVQLRSDAGSEVDGDYGTPQNVGASETAIEVDTTPSASITDGQHRYQTLFPGGTGAQSSLGEFTGVDLSLKRRRPFTVFARRTSGTGGTISAFTLNWEESW